MSDPRILVTVTEDRRPAIGFRDGGLDGRGYRGFEDIFRDPEDFIRERQRVYLDHLGGRISPSKGVDDLMKAFALLRRLHRPSATLHLVGATLGWERYAAGLEALIERIDYGGIILHDAERDALYARAGVVCLLSHHEGFCAPLIEAMRAGAPVVARDAGAVGETLGGGGVLLSDGDPRLAAEALEAVLGGRALRDRLRDDAQTALAAVEPAVVEARLRATLGAVLGTPSG